MFTTADLRALVIELVVVFVAHLIKKYGFPWLSEFRAQRSASYRRKRIEVWTKALEQYELDFAEGRRFMGRIVYRATITIILIVVIFAFLMLWQLSSVIYDVSCEFLNNCKDIPIAPLKQVKFASLLFFVSAMVFGGLFGLAASTLRDEITPEKHRSRLQESIARYRDRV